MPDANRSIPTVRSVTELRAVVPAPDALAEGVARADPRVDVAELRGGDAAQPRVLGGVVDADQA